MANPSTTVGVTFAIYKQQDGGAPIWLETQNVTPDTLGQYTVLLGSTRAEGMPSDLFSAQEERWLGVKIEGQPEQARVMLVSVPYAFKAHEAETLGGLPATAFVKAPSSDISGNASIDGVTAVNAAAAVASSKTSSLSGPSTPGYIPIWLGGLSFIDSIIYQDVAKNVGVGTTSPKAKVDVNGSINTAVAYLIGGNNALTASVGNSNLSLGPNTGSVGNGTFNIFSGVYAGQSNSGSDNTFVGAHAGHNNTTGSQNGFFGTSAGYSNTTGYANYYFGLEAGYGNSTGNHNSFFGNQTGFANRVSDNTFYGYNAGYDTVTGSNNTFVGSMAGYPNGTGGGSYNTAIGFHAVMGGGVNVTNATAIGGNAVVEESNALVLGGFGGNAVNVGIGTSTPSSALDIVGTLKLEGSGNGIIFPDRTEQTTAAVAGVTSWNGRVGAVVPQSGDYSFSQISQTLGSSQFSGTYGSAVNLSSGGNSFTGSGSGLTGIQFSQLSGTLGSSQLSGKYNQAATLSNGSNVFYGDGSHLTGIVVHTTAGCISNQQYPPGCPCSGKTEQCIGISNGGFCQVTSETGGCTASTGSGTYGSCTVCRPN